MNKQGNRQQQILQALARMLQATPGGKITTAALAAEVGVSEAALYRHFPSKTKMYEGLIDFIEETLFTRVRAITSEEENIESQLYRILTLLLTFSERNPGITRLLTGDALTGETARLHTRIQQLFDRLETQLKQILREAEAREGTRSELVPSAAASLLLATAEGRMSQFVRSGFNRPPTEHWQDQWQALMAGFFRSPGQAPL